MIFNYRKLISKITEKFEKRGDFAKLIPLSENSLSKKLNNKVPFTSPEIYKMVKILGIDESEIHIYFYTLKVE